MFWDNQTISQCFLEIYFFNNINAETLPWWRLSLTQICILWKKYPFATKNEPFFHREIFKLRKKIGHEKIVNFLTSNQVDFHHSFYRMKSFPRWDFNRVFYGRRKMSSLHIKKFFRKIFQFRRKYTTWMNKLLKYS